MAKKSLILFDLDGTLLDTSPGIFSTLRYICQKKNLNFPPDSQLGTIIGPPLKHSFVNLFGLSEEEAHESELLFSKAYNNMGIELSTPYEGIQPLLADLKNLGYKLGVATLKPQGASEKILSFHNIARFFDIIVGADLQKTSSKANIMSLAMNHLCTPPQSTLMIGDSASDAIGSQATKVDFLPVGYGFGLKDDEIQAYPHWKMASTPSQIKDIILEYTNG